MRFAVTFIALGALPLVVAAAAATPAATGAAHSSRLSPTTITTSTVRGPVATGQPKVECETLRPGRSSTAPGSAFNEEGKAGTMYAGEQTQNSRNTASVSQYDAACTHQR